MNERDHPLTLSYKHALEGLLREVLSIADQLDDMVTKANEGSVTNHGPGAGAKNPAFVAGFLEKTCNSTADRLRAHALDTMKEVGLVDP